MITGFFMIPFLLRHHLYLKSCPSQKHLCLSSPGNKKKKKKHCYDLNFSGRWIQSLLLCSLNWNHFQTIIHANQSQWEESILLQRGWSIKDLLADTLWLKKEKKRIHQASLIWCFLNFLNQVFMSIKLNGTNGMPGRVEPFHLKGSRVVVSCLIKHAGWNRFLPFRISSDCSNFSDKTN